MHFYSGFSLKNEQSFFKDYINSSKYSTCGFSYGAIKAFEHVKEQLASGGRVDTLELLSPAFFQTKESKFKKLQIMAYKKNEDAYLSEFIKVCFLPYAQKRVQHYKTDIEELEELLNYEWDMQELRDIAQKGVKIEVYLGGQDKIIDVEAAREFFLEVATVTYIKNANHFLQTT
jgi:hypothetical protein